MFVELLPNEQSNRGNSDLVGYAILFAMSTTAISAIILAGIPAIESGQQAQADQNAVAAFEVLDANIDAIHKNGDPSRTTEIRLTTGELRIGEPSKITVRTGDGSEVTTAPRPIIYEGDSGAEVIYENGLVARVAPNADPVNESYVSKAPQLDASQTVFFSLITTAPVGKESVTGTNAQLRKEKVSRGTADLPIQTDKLTITVESRHAEAWYQTFSNFEPADRFNKSVTRPESDTVVMEISRSDGSDFDTLIYRTQIDVFLAG